MIVCKFGGKTSTSLKSMLNVKKIIEENDERKIFVFSAIGKENDADEKLTDLLYCCAKEINNFEKTQKNTEKIIKKFKKLCFLLKIKLNINKKIKKYIKNYKKNNDVNYLVSRGEYLTTNIVAKYLGLKFVDARRVVFFKGKEIDWEKTESILKKIFKENEKIVVPGFYGCDENGKIKLFSRGGSDVSAAVIARALNAQIYENWTDVRGIFEVNPRIMRSKQILRLDYKALRFMTNCDANVIHKDCANILQNKGITLKVGSIFEPHLPATEVVDEPQLNLKFISFKEVGDVAWIYVFLKNTQKNQFFCKKEDKNAIIFEKYKKLK